MVTTAFAAALVAASSQALGAPTSPGAEASEAIQAVESRKAESAIAAEPIAKANQALDRARSTREAGDTTTAALLGRVAREWAQLAVSLLKAAEAERRADALEKSLSEIEDRTVRARALLEETVARRGRAQAQLARLEGGDASADASTSVAPKRGAPEAATGKAAPSDKTSSGEAAPKPAAPKAPTPPKGGKP